MYLPEINKNVSKNASQNSCVAIANMNSGEQKSKMLEDGEITRIKNFEEEKE